MEKETASLKSVPLFKNFSDRMLEEFAAAFKRSSYKAGEIIFREKSEGDTLFILVSGRVVIEKGLDNEGREFKPLAVLSDGEFFGEMAVLEGTIRFAQARAEQESSLYGIKRQELFKFIKEHPENGITIFTEIVRVISKRLQHTSSELTMLFDMSGLVMQNHQSTADFVRVIVEEIAIYFDGIWNFHGWAYDQFNEEFTAVVAKESFSQDPAARSPAGDAAKAAAKKDGLKSGWLSGSVYLMAFNAHGRPAGYVTFSKSAAVSDYEKNNLATIFNTISSIMGSAVENIESRMEAALLRKLKTRKETI
jgi:CRP/FNR family transcriptional regulator